MRGLVVSTKIQKTATVLIEDKKIHPLYGKSYIRSKKYLVDDPLGVKLGDIVEVKKIKPISKRKHWRIIKVIGRSMKEIVEEQLKEEAAEVIEEVMPISEELDKSKSKLVSDSENQKGENETKARSGRSGNVPKSKMSGKIGSSK